MRRRWLHARHAKGIACVFNTTGLHLSPVIGLLLHNTRALDSLWAEGEADGPPVARLARTLFNRHDPTEPLQPCRNKSQAAAHLTPRLQGACLGLALRAPDASDATVRTSLIEREGVDVLARQSKVSIARFERLVALVAEAARQRRPLTLGTDTEHAVAGVERAVQGRDDRVSAHGGGAAGAGGSAVGISGIDVFLAFVWASATSKRDVVDFLRALQSYVDDTAEATGDAPRLFAPSGDADAALRPLGDELEAAAFGAEVQYMLGGGSRSIAPDAAELEALETGGVAGAALERLAFTLVARHGCAPEVPQAVYGFRDQPAVADCVEACLREAIGLALWDRRRGAYDTALLPSTTDPRVVDFFARGDNDSGDGDGRRWYELLCARGPPLDYMLGKDAAHAYELFPSVDNFAATLACVLGVTVVPPPPARETDKGGDGGGGGAGGHAQAEEAPPLVPVWPGSPLRWQLLGDGRHPILLFRRVADAPERTGGDGGHAAEEMRVVFNGQRHCYSLRDGTRTTPAWVGALRRSWRRRVRRGEPLHPATHAAAARLLGLHGPCTLARHEALHLEAEALAARPASPGAL